MRHATWATSRDTLQSAYGMREAFVDPRQLR
jgi:hypothetical protein